MGWINLGNVTGGGSVYEGPDPFNIGGKSKRQSDPTDGLGNTPIGGGGVGPLIPRGNLIPDPTAGLRDMIERLTWLIAVGFAGLIALELVED